MSDFQIFYFDTKETAEAWSQQYRSNPVLYSTLGPYIEGDKWKVIVRVWDLTD